MEFRNDNINFGESRMEENNQWSEKPPEILLVIFQFIPFWVNPVSPIFVYNFMVGKAYLCNKF